MFILWYCDDGLRCVLATICLNKPGGQIISSHQARNKIEYDFFQNIFRTKLSDFVSRWIINDGLPEDQTSGLGKRNLKLVQIFQICFIDFVLTPECFEMSETGILSLLPWCFWQQALRSSPCLIRVSETDNRISDVLESNHNLAIELIALTQSSWFLTGLSEIG